VYASSEQFLLNTEAALRYYRDQNQHFDTVYLLGNQNFSKYQFSIGKNTQRNANHFLELYTGLAARHFLFNAPENQGTIALNSRKNIQVVSWNDLPESSIVKTALVNGVRFAYAWLSNVLPELNTAQEIGIKAFQRGAPWFTEFFRPEQGWFGARKGEELPDFSSPQEQKSKELITEWCNDYLRWIANIHQCDGDEIQLFRCDAFNFNGQVRDETFADLVIGDNREKGTKAQDTIQNLKNQLSRNIPNLTSPNTGMVGLAKALYILCRL
ncbi:MAG: hypothetical protein AAGF26_17650, partial [Cyanobacteria bacterium P01_G01_bin.49]